jgi:hypothetical protein
MMAGRWVSSITLAMVKVLPVPVAPRSTWFWSQIAIPLRQFAIAVGWSPAGFELRMHDEALAALELQVAAQRVDRAAGVRHLFWRVVVHGFLPDRDMLMASRPASRADGPPPDMAPALLVQIVNKSLISAPAHSQL